ncbi:type III pantothenate kinase [Nitrosomonas sp. PY1]|uniref:type III pantothenate kinase n=1 Tax=Nitrosomonas sp. PY1 TaxID=1803906 RepID=UPI001FC80CD6|nr:type III pantothenate kinase [Nitrosomonas sp. PY1]GKS68831.1 type III pantothenate kinase [Nitrosomonas sp. PY1]
MAILAIDSGNSYIKWGLYGANQWIKKGKVHQSDVSLLAIQFKHLFKPKLVVASHVGRVSTRHEIANIVASLYALEPNWIVAQEYGFGITNHYINPMQLGCDRWLALIAAWEKNNRRRCLVVNIGTAMTVDVLTDHGEFLGGIITPSAHLIFESLRLNTQLNYSQKSNYNDFPLTTNEAIHSGAIYCLVGAIERMQQLFVDKFNCSMIDCVISGGGASILLPFIKLPIVFVDELVLEGLVIIGNSDQIDSCSSNSE